MEKKGEGPAIGIDLGTTCSCLAIWQHGKVEIIVNAHGNRTTPSYVAFSGEDCLVGDAAKNQAARNPSNTVFDAKRLIGRRFSESIVQEEMKFWPFKVVGVSGDDRPMIVIECAGEEMKFAPEEISSMVLSNLREAAEAYIGTIVKNAVITVPAYFNNSQRQATKDAGVAAGLNVLRVINEPVAAAVAYTTDNKLSGGSDGHTKNVIVFDLGGGTFDISILVISGSGGVKVVATAGDTHLGGNDFDKRLVNHCIWEFERRHGKDPSCSPRALRRLRTASEKAKTALSFAAETTVDLESLFDGVDFQCTITSAKFEELNMDLFEKCIELVGGCLTDADMAKDDVHEVLLVGGSTRIPKVRELLQELFPETTKLCMGINPDEAVAGGAAIYAAALGGDGTQAVDDLDTFPTDITPLSLGIRTAGGKMSVLVPRNTAIPIKKEKVFTTSFDDQTAIRFQVFEGEGILTSNNNLLGIFELSGIPKAPRSVAHVMVRFDIDEDGILVVSAEDQNSKGKAKMTITDRNGWLGRDARKRMIKEVKDGDAEGDDIRRKVDARVELEKCANELRNVVRSDKVAARLEVADKEKVENEISQVLAWLRNQQFAEVKVLDDMREELVGICRPILYGNTSSKTNDETIDDGGRRSDKRFWKFWACRAPARAKKA